MNHSIDKAPPRAAQAARRVFMLQVAAAAGLLAGPALAQSRPRVDEDDDTAKQLGYRHDTTQVDVKRFPKHQNSQRCNNCAFYQGAASEPWAGCSFFGRKQVAGPGWCMAWQAKPAG